MTGVAPLSSFFYDSSRVIQDVRSIDDLGMTVQ
jgi:hypothetical protein